MMPQLSLSVCRLERGYSQEKTDKELWSAVGGDDAVRKVQSLLLAGADPNGYKDEVGLNPKP